MATFIEGDAGVYAAHAASAKRNVMVQEDENETLTCEIEGVSFEAETVWQLDSRITGAGFYGCSLWLDAMFSEPGVLKATQ